MKPTWPDGMPMLLKPREYIGYDHKTIDGKGVLTPIIKYEPRRRWSGLINNTGEPLTYDRLKEICENKKS